MKYKSRHVKKLVIKIGSNVLAEGPKLKKAFFRHLADQVEALRKDKTQVVIVSSGAIAAAMSYLNRKTRPKSVPEKQAYAAIGQPLLMDEYMAAFHKKKIPVAQILLTAADLSQQRSLLNAKHAFDQLFKNKVVPIVNENDTVSTDEIKFGDNDTLSSLVAELIGADLLLILSHVDGLYAKKPRSRQKAEVIPVVQKIDKKVESYLFSEHNERSTGGMKSKLIAAKNCLNAGIPVFITNGTKRNYIHKMMIGKEVLGTYFDPEL